MTDIKLGDHFTVTEVVEWRDARGRLIARFLPDQSYKVTFRNIPKVQELDADKKLRLLRFGSGMIQTGTGIAALDAKVSGKVTVRPRAQKENGA